MTNLYESNNYDLSFRGILSNNNFKLYTNNDTITISSDINFDINSDYRSSINYLASSILGGIAHTIIKESKHSDIDIEELEGKIYINLKNPLTLIGVKGYNDEPKIETCNIIFYIYSETEEKELQTFCQKSLNKSFIYNTLKNSISFNIDFILID